MRFVVITGANGFIGRRLAAYFASKNFKVYAVVRKKAAAVDFFSNMPNIAVIEGELRDYEQLACQIPLGADALFHLAWSGVSPEARNNSLKQMENVRLSLDAVQLANAVGAQRFILPGSTSEYCYCGQLINETAVPSPQNAYGAAKVSARYMCESLCREKGIPFIYAVITGVYGEGRNDNNVITYCIKELLRKQAPHLTKLEQRWDYIYIDDLIDALYLIGTKGREGAFYTIGHGDNWPLANYIKIIHANINPGIPLGIGELPYSGDKLPSSCVDLSSIYRDTGFMPRVAFERGIKNTIEWLKNQLENEEET